MKNQPSAYAVVHEASTSRIYAENQDVLNRVLGIHLVAQLPAEKVQFPAKLEQIRDLLRQERWADALMAWMEETSATVDVYSFSPEVYDSSARIWTDADVRSEDVQSALAQQPLFMNP